MCAPASTRATVYFPKSGEPQLFGTLRAGGALAVQYELERMTTCRATHNGYPAWDLISYVQFDPSAAQVSQSVRMFENHFGTPTTTAFAVPFHTTVPAGTTGVQLWFNNVAGVGYGCSDWDSVGGQNYRLSAN